MQSITNISKLILCALAITCSVLFLWHNNPWFPISEQVDANLDDITIADLVTTVDSKPLGSIDQTLLTSTSHTIIRPLTTYINQRHNKIITPPFVSTTITTKKTVIPTIWVEISKQFRIDHRSTSSQVDAEIKKILSNKKKFIQILQASAPYISYIYTQTQMRRLPAEIALVPVIESEFNPNDHSNKGAAGLWQLMPQTARELGIKVHSGYDGRRNIIDSTRAALAYFKDLEKLFKGNWYLALAAYNCGQVKVQSVVRRVHTNNYWQLPLPRETKLYVPKLLAVAEIIHHPERYGIHLPTITSKPYFVAVKTKQPVTLTKYSQQAGIDIALLKKLNPDLKSANATAYNKQLLIPA